MGLLSGFAAGASQGVMQGWAEIREDKAIEARQMFQERLADKQYERGRKDQLDDRAYLEGREADIYKRNRGDQIDDEERTTESAKDLQQWKWENEPKEPGERWVDVVNENGEVVNQRSSKTGALKWSAKDRGKGSGNNAEIKANLKPLSMGEGIEIPNVWIDTKSGYVVDPSGSLTKPTVDDDTLKAQVDAEVKEMRGGVMGMGKKSDEQAFGTTEENYRKMRLEQLKSESPTLAQQMGFDNSRVLRSERELQSIYDQQGVDAPVSGQKPVTASGVAFDMSMFDNEPEAPTSQPEAPEKPASQSPEKPVNEPRISDDERAVLDEMGISLGEFEKRTPSPYANTDVTGTVSRFFEENAPVLTNATDNMYELPKRSAKAYGGLIVKAGEAIINKHRDMVASGEKMRAKDKERNTAKLAKAFFNGEPSIYAAKAVIDSGEYPEGSKERRAAEIYLKAKGQQ